MVSKRNTKTAISLDLMMISSNFRCPLKALMFVNLMIKYSRLSDLSYRESEFKTCLSFLSKVSHLL